MIDSGATEDFIDKEFCQKYRIKTMEAEKIREIYLADGQPSDMGPVTHTAEVLMDIGANRESYLRQHKVHNVMPERLTNSLCTSRRRCLSRQYASNVLQDRCPEAG